MDVAVLARSYRARSPLPKLWSRLAIAWIGFMMLNATLVFGPRGWWPAAAIFAALFAAARVRRQTTKRTLPPGS
jgi:hypothetical protein